MLPVVCAGVDVECAAGCRVVDVDCAGVIGGVQRQIGERAVGQAGESRRGDGRSVNRV